MMFLWLSWGLTTTQNSIRKTSDLDPEYRIDASLLLVKDSCQNYMKTTSRKALKNDKHGRCARPMVKWKEV